MALFVRSEQPDSADLALGRLFDSIYGKGEAFTHFVDQLTAQNRYWQRQMRISEAAVDVARYDLAFTLSTELAKVDEQTQTWAAAEPDEAATWQRGGYVARGIAAIALSRLTRRILPYKPGDLRDGRAQQRADIVPEVIKNADGTPGDYCLHLPTDVAEPHFEGAAPSMPSQSWYRGNGLYINRILPAAPEKDTLTFLQERGIAVDFSVLQTLVPYQEGSF